MLMVDETQRPFICFPDVPYEEMQAVLNFMYQGETNLPDSKVESFLNLAKFLKLKGFVEPDEDNFEAPPPKKIAVGRFNF